MLPFDDRVEASLATFREWLAAVPEGGHVVVAGSVDADGLAAAALFGRSLPLLGALWRGARVTTVATDAPAISDAVRAWRPDALVLAGLGVAPHETNDVPTLYVDSHRPGGVPDAPGVAFVVSGYDWAPRPCSAWLAYSLLEGAVPDVDELRELDWLAAVGVLSALGDRAPWPPLPEARRRHTADALREAVARVDAARDAPAAGAALAGLLEADGPRDLLATLAP